ncbi:DUF4142 domain-containing protein [Pontibacter sp. MBLB2868]|uniref:DUF4142 domain-containing protein n=1 Tax=Pontibacter sp. MBLB2868 TaxID=3451555 RepID=UPI003F75650E
MKRTILTYLASAALLFATACDSNDSIEIASEKSVQQYEAAGVQNMKNDALFAAEAASSNMLQIQLSEAALERGVSPEVKDFAQEMVKDHRQMMDELQDLASKTQLVLPETLGNAHQKVYTEITDKQGIAFDVAYIREMVDQHKNLLDRYEDISENGNSMELKQFASKQLPIIRQHLEMAERMEEKID